MSRRTRLYRRHRHAKIEDTAASINAQHAQKGKKHMKASKVQRLSAALHRTKTYR